MTDIVAPSTDTQHDLLAVRPRGNAGYLVHLTPDVPSRRAEMGVGNRVFRCTTLCKRKADGSLKAGVSRFTDHLIQGGHETPTPWREAIQLHAEPYICWPCVIKAGGL